MELPGGFAIVCLSGRVVRLLSEGAQIMQAIRTKYMGPTNHRGSRIVAECSAGRVIVSWLYDLGDLENHVKAAEALRSKLGWEVATHGRLFTGTLKDGSFVHVMGGRV